MRKTKKKRKEELIIILLTTVLIFGVQEPPGIHELISIGSTKPHIVEDLLQFTFTHVCLDSECAIRRRNVFASLRLAALMFPESGLPITELSEARDTDQLGQVQVEVHWVSPHHISPSQGRVDIRQNKSSADDERPHPKGWGQRSSGKSQRGELEDGLYLHLRPPAILVWRQSLSSPSARRHSSLSAQSSQSHKVDLWSRLISPLPAERRRWKKENASTL